MTQNSQPVLRPAKERASSGKRKGESRDRLLLAARRLFIERGYHATRPQDVARAAGVGHGTFYLHFADKKACFLAFVDEARQELRDFVSQKTSSAKGLEGTIEAVLDAIYDYAESHPGVLATAMTDETVIGRDGPEVAQTLLAQWGEEWAVTVRQLAQDHGGLPAAMDEAIVGQAIVGAIHQASAYSYWRKIPRHVLVKSLTKFIVRALHA
ncbi:MAG TPA: hypothetical protein DCL54_14035 [Alphaproteobacteria bacterium]|nr:hypothetical protein [Alphaproteobacteria bacterium]